MAAGTVVNVRLGIKSSVAQTAFDRVSKGGMSEAASAVANLLASLQQRGGKLVIGVDAVADGSTVGEDVAVTVTITDASLVSGTDSLTIGATTIVWETSPVDEDDVAIGGSDAASGVNLAAAINAHSALQGVVSATDDGAGVVTVTYAGADRMAQHLLIAEAGSGQVLSATSFAPSGTLTATGAIVSHSK